MIGTTIRHHEILEKLGEVPKSPTSGSLRVAATVSLRASRESRWQAGTPTFLSLSKDGGGCSGGVV